MLLSSIGPNELETHKFIKQHVKVLINQLSKIVRPKQSLCVNNFGLFSKIHEQLKIPGITDGGLKAEVNVNGVLYYVIERFH